MRRGLLQDYANTVCHIFTGWRLLVSPGDLPLLLALGDGSMRIDLMDGTAVVNGEVTPFGMAEELHAWLRQRADLDGLGWSNVTRAEMTVNFSCREAPGRRRDVATRELAFVCNSAIDSDGASASAVLESREVGVRQGDGPWVVH